MSASRPEPVPSLPDVQTVPSDNASYYFDYDQLEEDIPHVVRGMDNVIERTKYPLAEQRADLERAQEELRRISRNGLAQQRADEERADRDRRIRSRIGLAEQREAAEEERRRLQNGTSVTNRLPQANI